jgi:hypothetical protein
MIRMNHNLLVGPGIRLDPVGRNLPISYGVRVKPSVIDAIHVRRVLGVDTAVPGDKHLPGGSTYCFLRRAE